MGSWADIAAVNRNLAAGRKRLLACQSGAHRAAAAHATWRQRADARLAGPVDAWAWDAELCRLADDLLTDDLGLNHPRMDQRSPDEIVAADMAEWHAEDVQRARAALIALLLPAIVLAAVNRSREAEASTAMLLAERSGHDAQLAFASPIGVPPPLAPRLVAAPWARRALPAAA